MQSHQDTSVLTDTGMTVGEWLHTPYFWIPMIASILLVGYCVYREKKIARKNASKLNHPSAKWKQHDRHYQKKYNV